MNRIPIVLLVLLLSLGVANAQTETFGNFINSLPSANSLGPSDQFYVRQGGVSKKVTGSVLPSGVPLTCGGVDDTAALNAAISAASSSTGIVSIPPTVCAINGNISITGVSLVGNNASYGYFANQGTAPYTLLLNSSSTINMGSNSRMQGVRVIRQGVTQPNSLRSSITAANAFAGTAITITNTVETALDHVTIIGFQYAIKASGDRLSLNYVTGDNTNGIQQTECGDSCSADHIEFWPYLAAPYSVSPQFQTSTVSNVTNSGGLFEITLSGAPATPIVTGDIVVIGLAGGFAAGVAPNGRWIVTAIDTTHFTLNGSTFAGGYTTGGTAYLTSTRRTGKAIEVIGTGSLWVTSFIEYGYDTSWHIGATAYGNRCNGCWFDGDLANDPDPVPIGVLLDGTPADTTMNGSWIGDKAISIKNNITGAIGNSLSVTNTTIGATGVAAGVVGSGLQAFGGQTSIGAGSQFRDVCAAPTNQYAYIADGVGSVVFYGLLEAGEAACFPLTPQFQSSVGCPKFTRDGVVGRVSSGTCVNKDDSIITGLVCDSVHNDFPVLQAALNAVAISGGTIKLPEGNFTCNMGSNTLTFPGNYVTLDGGVQGTTLSFTNVSANDVLIGNGSGLPGYYQTRLRNLTIRDLSRTSGQAVQVIGASQPSLYNVQINSSGATVALWAQQFNDMMVDQSFIFGGLVLFSPANNAQRSDQFSISNSLILPNTTSPCWIWDGMVQTVNAYNTVMLNCTIGLTVSNNSANASFYPGFGTFVNFQVDGATAQAVWIQGGYDMQFIGSDLNSSGTTSDVPIVQIDPDATHSVTRQVKFIGGGIHDTYGRCLVTNSVDFSLIGTDVYDCGKHAANTYAAIEIAQASGTSNALIANSKIGFATNQSSTSNYGVIVDSSVSGAVLLSANNYGGNATGAINDASSKATVLGGIAIDGVSPLALPTSCTGHPTGSLRNNSGVVNVC